MTKQTNELTTFEFDPTQNLDELSIEQKRAYYNTLCASLKLNPLTEPFKFIYMWDSQKKGQKLTLYATKDCTDQLRVIRGISVEKVDHKIEKEQFFATAYAKDATGRSDVDIGCVSVAGLSGINFSNACMKGVTKAKRRVTLSIAGLAIIDESELDSIKDVTPANIPIINSKHEPFQYVFEYIVYTGEKTFDLLQKKLLETVSLIKKSNYDERVKIVNEYNIWRNNHKDQLAKFAKEYPDYLKEFTTFKKPYEIYFDAPYGLEVDVNEETDLSASVETIEKKKITKDIHALIQLKDYPQDLLANFLEDNESVKIETLSLQAQQQLLTMLQKY